MEGWETMTSAPPIAEQVEGHPQSFRCPHMRSSCVCFLDVGWVHVLLLPGFSPLSRAGYCGHLPGVGGWGWGGRLELGGGVSILQILRLESSPRPPAGIHSLPWAGLNLAEQFYHALTSLQNWHFSQAPSAYVSPSIHCFPCCSPCQKYPFSIFMFYFTKSIVLARGFPSGPDGKESACQWKRHGFSPWVGLARSPGEGKGNPLQYSCLGNPMDRGAWYATVHGVTKSQTQVSD